MVYRRHGILLSDTKEQTVDTHNLDESQAIMLSEKSQSKRLHTI